jgi:hypothetical protein
LVGNALASLAIVALVALIGLGLPLLDRSLSATRALAAGGRIAVGGGVSLVPPNGATLDVSQTRPGDRHGTALLILGPIRYAAVAVPCSGPLTAAASRLRDQISGRPGYSVAGNERAVRTDTGVDGRAGGYDSPGRVGEYTVFFFDSRCVQLTVSGPSGVLSSALPAFDASARSVAFAPTS